MNRAWKLESIGITRAMPASKELSLEADLGRAISLLRTSTFNTSMVLSILYDILQKCRRRNNCMYVCMCVYVYIRKYVNMYVNMYVSA